MSSSRMGDDLKLDSKVSSVLGARLRKADDPSTPENKLRSTVINQPDEPEGQQRKPSKRKAKTKTKKPPPEDLVPVNFWGHEFDKARVAAACTLHGKKRYDLLSELMDLYEKKHGALPVPGRPEK